MLNNKTNILIKTNKEISYMREAGNIIAEIMNKLEKAVEPGISTIELDNTVSYTHLTLPTTPYV